MRVELIGHFKPCMTAIYLHIDARMADYIRTHPYTEVGPSTESSTKGRGTKARGTKAQPKWKGQSEAFRAMLKQGRKDKDLLKQGFKMSDLPPPENMMEELVRYCSCHYQPPTALSHEFTDYRVVCCFCDWRVRVCHFDRTIELSAPAVAESLVSRLMSGT